MMRGTLADWGREMNHWKIYKHNCLFQRRKKMQDITSWLAKDNHSTSFLNALWSIDEVHNKIINKHFHNDRNTEHINNNTNLFSAWIALSKRKYWNKTTENTPPKESVLRNSNHFFHLPLIL